MSLYKNLPFDALRDFAPISVFAESPNLLVAHQSAGASVKELVAQAKRQARLAELLLGRLRHHAAPGRRAVQGCAPAPRSSHIPYKGTAASLTAVIAGEVQFSFANVPAILGHVQERPPARPRRRRPASAPT